MSFLFHLISTVFNLCLCRDGRWDRVRIQHECIKCLKAISNNKQGLKRLCEHREALTLLARSFVPSLPLVMVDAVKLMACVCLVPPDGHEKVLEAITTSGEMSGNSRFQPIIEALGNLENDTLTVRISLRNYQMPPIKFHWLESIEWTAKFTRSVQIRLN